MRSYLRMMLFALGLLAGVQIPGIVDLYYQRLDARLQQASLSLAPFQRTADQHFGGDLDALIAHYGASQDPVFTQDATTLRNYGYVVPLKQAAIFCGVAVGLLASLLGDLLLSLLLLPFRQRQPAPRHALR